MRVRDGITRRDALSPTRFARGPYGMLRDASRGGFAQSLADDMEALRANLTGIARGNVVNLVEDVLHF